MKTFQYTTEHFLPISINEAWEFFSSAKNLSLITPPEMEIKITSALLAKEIYEGMLIKYRIKPLFKISMNWQTQIIKVQKPFLFIDKQLKGPYGLWEHTHIFAEKGNGVLTTDSIKYGLPFGFIGTLAHSLIRKKIENIFNYRKKTLNKIFRNHGTIPG